MCFLQCRTTNDKNIVLVYGTGTAKSGDTRVREEPRRINFERSRRPRYAPLFASEKPRRSPKPPLFMPSKTPPDTRRASLFDDSLTLDPPARDNLASVNAFNLKRTVKTTTNRRAIFPRANGSMYIPHSQGNANRGSSKVCFLPMFEAVSPLSLARSKSCRHASETIPTLRQQNTPADFNGTKPGCWHHSTGTYRDVAFISPKTDEHGWMPLPPKLETKTDGLTRLAHIGRRKIGHGQGQNKPCGSRNMQLKNKFN